jgi:tetratricopeptide (TPR) repeat protein
VLASEEALPRALQYLQKGMDIVGENALFNFGIAYIYFQYENIGTKPDGFYLQKAEEYTRKVFELKTESSHGYLLLGLIQTKRGKLQEAVRHLKKALSIDFNDLDTLFWLSLVYLEVGKSSAAAPLIDRLLQLDPFTPIYQLMPGWLHLMDGRFDMALESCRKGFKMEPGNTGVRFYYALALALNNRISEAYSLIDVMVREVPDDTYSRMGAICKYALQRDKAKVLKSLTQKVTNTARRDEQYSWILAECFSLISEKKRALYWLENSVNRGFINYPFLNEYNPFLENIRGEPRFKKLMKRVKHEWENFEV